MLKNLGIFSVFLYLVLAAGVSKAQSASSTLSPAIAHRIQMEIRTKYDVSPKVDIALSPLEPSDIPGYEKFVVTFTHDEKKTVFDFLVSKDRKTLARFEKMDISQDLMSKIDVKGRPVRGSEQASVTIVNYDDLQCPFCARMHAVLFPGLLKEYGNRVKFIYKDFPLVDIHPWAMHAAIDANCLAAQNSEAYWDFADYVHANAKTMGGQSPEEGFLNLDKRAFEQGETHHLDKIRLNACIQKSDESAVRASMAEGDELGVDATPTMFVNGERVSGFLTEEEMRSVIDRALADAGVQTPSSGGGN